MKTRKKPFTTGELFDTILQQIREDGKLPQHIDYAVATMDSVDIKDYGFDVVGQVNYGGSEGIYVDVFTQGDIGRCGELGAFSRHELGTIKTLEENDDAFRDMALLMAEFQVRTTRFIRRNMDDFEWTGYHIDFYMCGQSESSSGAIMKGKTWPLQEVIDYAEHTMKELPKYERAVITDNATNTVVKTVWSQAPCPHCLAGLCSMASDDVDCNGTPEERAECAYCD